MHHSLLHLAVSEIANVTNDLAPIQTIADNSEAQERLNASSSIGIAMVANVQATPTDVPRAFDIFLATAWIDLHTAEGRCLKSACYSIKDQHSVSFPSLSVRLVL
jgi:hypothetical protein